MSGSRFFTQQSQEPPSSPVANIPRSETPPPVEAVDSPPASPDSPTDVESQQDDARPKRARIDATVAPPGNSAYKTPLARAEEHIIGTTASLHEGIATLLLDLGKSHLALSHRAHNKVQNIKRMQDDEEYVPVSARIAFRLQVAKEAEESQEYIALQEETAQFIKGMRLELKKRVITCAKIELNAIQEQRSRNLCEAMHATCNIFHVAQGIPERDVHWTVKSIIENHGATLLRYHNESIEEFIKLYVTTTGATFNQDDEPDDDPPVEIHRACEDVFVTPWIMYRRQSETNEISLTLKKRVKETLLAKKTANATMTVDDELPADRQTLDELIRKAATKLSKTLIRNEVSSQLKQANNQRGSRQKSASEKKKSGNKVPRRDTSKPPPTKQKQKPAQQKQKQKQGASQRQRGNKDADPANASRSDSGKKQRSRSATPRGKPNGNSNRKKSQS